jgi:hypothetical protein
VGHANISNLSDLFVNLLYAKGKLTIGDAVKAAEKRGEKLHASEGDYEAETGMIGLALDECCAFLTCDARGAHANWGWEGQWDGPFIEPCLDIMSPKLIKIFHDWNINKEGIDESWELTDQIPWKFCKGKRKLYRDIPRLSNITN